MKERSLSIRKFYLFAVAIAFAMLIVIHANAAPYSINGNILIYNGASYNVIVVVCQVVDKLMLP